MMAYIIAIVLIGLHVNNGFAAKVCVIDTGITPKSRVFKNRIKATYDCTREGIRDRHVGSHGTAVASVIAKHSKHDLYICKAGKGSKGETYHSASICCIHRCAKWDVDWMSMSFGGTKKSRIREKVIQKYYADGIKFSASHGNRYGGLPSYPGQLDEVISVRGVDKHGNPYKYNSSGQWDAQALGCMYVYDRRGRSVWRCGSSFANPFYVAQNLSDKINRVRTSDKSSHGDMPSNATIRPSQVLGPSDDM